jgi:hypothetical protein
VALDCSNEKNDPKARQIKKKKMEEKKQMSVKEALKTKEKGLKEGRASMRKGGNLHSKNKERAF